MNPLPQRTSSAAWVRGIAELFAAEGLPVQALGAQADLALESLQPPHPRGGGGLKAWLRLARIVLTARTEIEPI